jgi:hypothetical protein
MCIFPGCLNNTKKGLRFCSTCKDKPIPEHFQCSRCDQLGWVIPQLRQKRPSDIPKILREIDSVPLHIDENRYCGVHRPERQLYIGLVRGFMDHGGGYSHSGKFRRKSVLGIVSSCWFGVSYDVDPPEMNDDFCYFEEDYDRDLDWNRITFQLLDSKSAHITYWKGIKDTYEIYKTEKVSLEIVNASDVNEESYPVEFFNE